MAKVISRFSVSSKSDEVNFLDVAASLPNSYKKLIQKGHPVILNNGKNTGRIHKESSISYEYVFEDVVDVQVCNEHWMESWKGDLTSLETLTTRKHILFHLDYELTIYDGSYPVLYFYPEFMSVLSRLNI